MDTGPYSVTDVVRAVVTVIGARGSIQLVVCLASAYSVAGISASRTRRQIRMRASTDPIADIIGTVVPVVRTRGSGGLIVNQARPGAIAGIRVRAIRVRRVPTGRPGRQIRMRTRTGSVADVSRTFVTVVGTCRSIQLVIVQTDAHPVAGVRVCAIIVCGIATGGT